MFGPHETNLGAGRAFSPRHVAPRTAAEAVLEGRRRALEIGALDAGALEREEPPSRRPRAGPTPR